MLVTVAQITFPEIRLHPHYGHKLRGYFGNLFREKSPLLHNHFENGELRYGYPLVQYKVINGIPMLVGIAEGAELLTELFLKIKHLDLEEKKFNIYAKNILNFKFKPGVSDSLIVYKFKLPWMALNTKNHRKYIKLLPGAERRDFLNKILIGNILSFYKGINFRISERIYADVEVREEVAMLKNNKMAVFRGEFRTNALLPDLIGLGKSVSRGFGAIKKSE